MHLLTWRKYEIKRLDLDYEFFFNEYVSEVKLL